MTCKRCEDFINSHDEVERDGKPMLVLGENSYMDVPTCAFDKKTKEFKSDNWSCQTMIGLRDIADYHGYNDDESINVISMSNGKFIILTYYKHRGKTGNAIVMCDDEPIIPLTLDLAEGILNE